MERSLKAYGVKVFSSANYKVKAVKVRLNFNKIVYDFFIILTHHSFNSS